MLLRGTPEPAPHPAGAPLTPALCILAVISVNHPLDYEQLANGVIYLTVMAKDAGNPPLNSTVPVTIEVFVSAWHSSVLSLLHSSAVHPSKTLQDYPSPWMCVSGFLLHVSHTAATHRAGAGVEFPLEEGFLLGDTRHHSAPGEDQISLSL